MLTDFMNLLHTITSSPVLQACMLTLALMLAASAIFIAYLQISSMAEGDNKATASDANSDQTAISRKVTRLTQKIRHLKRNDLPEPSSLLDMPDSR